MLCTSGFMDDVTFGRSGPYVGRCDTGAESDVYMNALCMYCFYYLHSEFFFLYIITLFVIYFLPFLRRQFAFIIIVFLFMPTYFAAGSQHV